MTRTTAILAIIIAVTAIVLAHDSMAVRGFFGCERVANVEVYTNKFGQKAPGGRYECAHGTWDIKD